MFTISTRFSPQVHAQIIRLSDEAATEALMAVALAGEAYAKRHMSTRSPSAPGSQPAVVIGNLVNNLQAQPKGPRWARLTSSADYSMYLEYGTVHMAARPFMAPAARYMEEQFENIMGAAMRELL